MPIDPYVARCVRVLNPRRPEDDWDRVFRSAKEREEATEELAEQRRCRLCAVPVPRPHDRSDGHAGKLLDKISWPSWHSQPCFDRMIGRRCISCAARLVTDYAAGSEGDQMDAINAERVDRFRRCGDCHDADCREVRVLTPSGPVLAFTLSDAEARLAPAVREVEEWADRMPYAEIIQKAGWVTSQQ